MLDHALHPLDARPISLSYLAQAKESNANVIALADAGNDTTNALKAAAAQHMIPGKQTIVALALRTNAIDTLGLQTTQGQMLAELFYWDLNDARRAWSALSSPASGRCRTRSRPGLYSSVLHYLKAIQQAGTDATDPVMAAMRALPVDDLLFAHCPATSAPTASWSTTWPSVPGQNPGRGRHCGPVRRL